MRPPPQWINRFAAHAAFLNRPLQAKRSCSLLLQRLSFLCHKVLLLLPLERYVHSEIISASLCDRLYTLSICRIIWRMKTRSASQSQMNRSRSLKNRNRLFRRSLPARLHARSSRSYSWWSPRLSRLLSRTYDCGRSLLPAKRNLCVRGMMETWPL